jgi:broad specificity phosphatase PhoE
MRLTLVRHAESIWNASQTWQGQTDVPLSARGRLQARSLAARLFGASFDHRRASDLSRAFETASALGPEPLPDPRFREIDVGAWAGLAQHEVAARFPDEVAGLRAGEPVRIGGGESMPEFEARVDAAVDALRVEHPGRRVLVVTHGGVIRAMATRVLGMRGRPSPLVGAGNTSLTQLAAIDERYVLEVYNDALHLEPADLEPTVAPEPTMRLALVAADPDVEGDRATADRLLSGLGIARIGAAGAAADLRLSDDLVADRMADDPRAALDALIAEQEGGAAALVLTPDAVRSLLTDVLSLDAAGLALPLHGAVAQLRWTKKRALLHSYGVRFDEAGSR